MIEAAVSIALAAANGLGVVITRLQNRTNELDRRLDNFELVVARTYVPRDELVQGYERLEDRMVRIEEKLDKILLTK